MTDNEIIKALECCSTGETYADCEKNGCPLYLGITMGCKYIDKENQLYSDALDLINRQQAKIENLEYKLFGVMHFVDKWLDGAELEQDEVNRAATMREKTLQITEKQQAEIERLKAFKSYFDELYGKGLDVANWHLNSELEPFDNFYESALQEVVGEE